MYNIYYIEADKLSDFINRLESIYKVFLPAIKDSSPDEIDYYYKVSGDQAPFIFNEYRLIEPVKSFLNSPLEKVTAYFHQDKNIVDLADKTIIFGLKNCDVSSFKLQDFVFLEGVEADSLYRLKRENTIFVSGDCTSFKDVCFCMNMDILPYPTSGFDLNLSPLNDGYLIEVGSGRADELIQEYKEYFALAKETQIASRKTKREKVAERIKKHLLPQDLPSKDILQRLVKEGYSLDTWQEFMLTCVECGGCNFICPMCHCFLLGDKRENQQNEKLRLWDSCQYTNFAKVAGGANPLKARKQRFRNRFLKKFDFFMDNLGMPGCTGCGRCIEVCPGKIDLREVLKDLAKKLNKAAR
ncbi:MAG: 4Fe-4S dicluster domain-containing protein [Candidatus Omnitrophica bacterium]|nr:4Fe-4S dicluster domain-containing protein [Candidatus Omnitrophota bacterium]MBU4472956.1 4Fe-4S dicluster domain-containing protein [Candidatus Omnitrophota bacterium]MCG2706987.1 4Fe-4S dicluster domain-containing protein [Candidatus Omnitrophota bacterium]